MVPGRYNHHGRSVLLLNSSHGRFTIGSAPWVRATVSALESLYPDSDTLVTSIGLPGWELPAFLAAQRGFRQKLIIPGHDNPAGARYYNRCLENLELTATLTEPVFTGTGGSKQFCSARDLLALELADLVCPVSLRPGGRLDTLLGEYLARGGKTYEQCRIEYNKKNWTPRYCLDYAKCNTGLHSFGSGWLTHWTHSYPGPWPGETSAKFYRDMLAEPDTYVRSAGATLARILDEGVVRASGTHMTASEITVSLTSLPPIEALATMRWRSRWRRWNMEPYGIAMRKEILVPLGARQVSYYDKLPPDLTDAEKIFSQRRGQFTNWSDEREWRIHADLRLNDLSPDDVALLVYDGDRASNWPGKAGLYRIVNINDQNY